MFYYLEGVVTIMQAGLAVIDIGGVGYACHTTMNTLSYLETGKKARLYTYCNVKEDAFDIFGFYDIAEKRCFELLITVSGVGPKAALAILSVVTPDELTMAIITDNDKALTAAQGVGKRIAQRVILELKDKITKESESLAFPSASSVKGSAVMGQAGKLSEATAALLVLGYAQGEINTALKGVNVDDMSVEEIIRTVLKGSVK